MPGRRGAPSLDVNSHINISLVMVEDGQAFAYRRHPSGRDGKEYLLEAAESLL